ncbi:hypothetical protein ANN_07393 [Periplaneta americana]|uniref:Uncharacterized protein n=1 Tax=Periplaneta americana TaxID=6978 RepID=A0ABQ8SYH1_PERAM|nr:hypothetical protein ANN_07393 [Periplaneta americana]
MVWRNGCTVVLFNPKKNRQTHLLNSSRKTITCLAFSAGGRYLVTGECGHLPSVRVWDLQEGGGTQIAEFPGHKYGINCVSAHSRKFSVRQAILRSPGRSARRHSAALGISNRTPRVYEDKPRILDELKDTVRQHITQINRDPLERIEVNFRQRLKQCVMSDVIFRS